MHTFVHSLYDYSEIHLTLTFTFVYIYIYICIRLYILCMIIRTFTSLWLSHPYIYIYIYIYAYFCIFSVWLFGHSPHFDSHIRRYTYIYIYICMRLPTVGTALWHDDTLTKQWGLNCFPLSKWSCFGEYWLWISYFNAGRKPRINLVYTWLFYSSPH